MRAFSLISQIEAAKQAVQQAKLAVDVAQHAANNHVSELQKAAHVTELRGAVTVTIGKAYVETNSAGVNNLYMTFVVRLAADPNKLVIEGAVKATSPDDVVIAIDRTGSSYSAIENVMSALAFLKSHTIHIFESF